MDRSLSKRTSRDRPEVESSWKGGPKTLNISLGASQPFEIPLLWILSLVLYSIFWLGCLVWLVVSFLSSLYILDISPLLDMGLVILSSQSEGCWFVLSTMPFALQKPCSFMRTHLSILDLRAWAIEVLFRKFTPVPMSSRLFSNFSSIRFTVSGFMLRFLIRFNLRFVQGDKYGSIFILLHTDSQLDQHHLLQMLSLFHCIFLVSLSKIKWL